MSSGERAQSRIRIVVADDHAVVRAGVKSLLTRQRDLLLVGEAGNSAELVARARETTPDVIVTDLRMPDGGVLDAIAQLTTEREGTKVIVFSAFDDPSDASEAFRAGASGYVLKQSEESDLLTAVRRVHAGKRYVDPPLAARMLEDGVDLTGDPASSRVAALTEREARVLDLVARGYTGREIATELGVHLGTVETFRHRIRKKLGLKSRADVVRFARATGLRRGRP